jgi:hypothetical protein
MNSNNKKNVTLIIGKTVCIERVKFLTNHSDVSKKDTKS